MISKMTEPFFQYKFESDLDIEVWQPFLYYQLSVSENSFNLPIDMLSFQSFDNKEILEERNFLNLLKFYNPQKLLKIENVYQNNVRFSLKNKESSKINKQ